MSRKEKDPLPMQRVRTRKGRQDLPDLSIKPEASRLPIQEIAQRIQAMAVEHSTLFEHELQALKVRMVDINQLFEYLSGDSPQLEAALRIIEGGIRQPLAALYERLVRQEEAQKAQEKVSEAQAQHETIVFGLLAEADSHFAKMCHAFQQEVQNARELVTEDARSRKVAQDIVASLHEQLVEGQRLVEKTVATGNELQRWLRQTSLDLRTDQLHGEAVVERSKIIDRYREQLAGLTQTHANLQQKHFATLQKFDAAIKEIRQWEGSWQQRMLELGRMGTLFERAGIDAYGMAGTDREQLFTLPGYEERQEFYRHLPEPFPVLKATLSSNQFSELDDLFLRLMELSTAKTETAPPPVPPPVVTPPPPVAVTKVTGLHLLVYSYYVIGYSYGHAALFECLQSSNLTFGVKLAAWQDALRQAFSRDFFETALGSSKDREGIPKVVCLSNNAKKTVEACSWKQFLPANFATQLEAGLKKKK